MIHVAHSHPALDELDQFLKPGPARLEPKSDDIVYSCRRLINGDEMVELVNSHDGRPEAGRWTGLPAYGLSSVTGRSRDGSPVRFVTVVGDRAKHAFSLDTTTGGGWRDRGIVRKAVRRAAGYGNMSGCVWRHVLFGVDLKSSCVDACGTRPTDAEVGYPHTLT
jgi:hypothetical protein